jgi:hypothetical protein
VQEIGDTIALVVRLFKMTTGMYKREMNKRPDTGCPRDERVLRVERNLGLYGLELQDPHRFVQAVYEAQRKDELRDLLLLKASK